MNPLFGLTGGIGCGKSSAVECFANLGVDWVDADQVAREVVEPGEPAFMAIREAFGPQSVGANGSLDRAWLRAEVFADEHKRKHLEAITHPVIRARLLEKVHEFRSTYGLLVTPLLFETDQHKLVDKSILVDVPEAVQLERAMRRDNASAEQIHAIMAAQMSRSERLARADYVLDNRGGLDDLEAQVVRLHHELIQALV